MFCFIVQVVIEPDITFILYIIMIIPQKIGKNKHVKIRKCVKKFRTFFFLDNVYFYYVMRYTIITIALLMRNYYKLPISRLRFFQSEVSSMCSIRLYEGRNSACVSLPTFVNFHKFSFSFDGAFYTEETYRYTQSC